MAITEVTLTVFLVMLGMTIAMLVNAVAGRKLGIMAYAGIIVSFVALPILMFYLLVVLDPLIVLRDWISGGAGRYAAFNSPVMFTTAGCLLGGCLGIAAGNSWVSEGNASCLRCLLVPIGLLLVTSTIFLLLP